MSVQDVDEHGSHLFPFLWWSNCASLPYIFSLFYHTFAHTFFFHSLTIKRMGDYDSPHLPSFDWFIYVVPVFVPFLLHICTNFFYIPYIFRTWEIMSLHVFLIFAALYKLWFLAMSCLSYSIIHSLLPLYTIYHKIEEDYDSPHFP